MHYILNADNYISAISFGCDIECEDGSCTEYTGSVPTGYTTLEAWYAAEGEKLYRWKIVNGQLTKDDDAVAPAPDKPPYAPEGYGLGEASGQIVTDCDAAVLSGWYQLGEYAANAPDAEGYLMRVSACAGCIYQEVFADGSTVVRWYKSGTWTAWEWVNPPMVLGVEYRTTKRHCGKPVYAKAFDFGPLPNANIKTVVTGISDGEWVVSCTARTSNGVHLPYRSKSGLANLTGGLNGAVYQVMLQDINANNVTIATNADYTTLGACITLEYTKTTD